MTDRLSGPEISKYFFGKKQTRRVSPFHLLTTGAAHLITVSTAASEPSKRMQVNCSRTGAFKARKIFSAHMPRSATWKNLRLGRVIDAKLTGGSGSRNSIRRRCKEGEASRMASITSLTLRRQRVTDSEVRRERLRVCIGIQTRRSSIWVRDVSDPAKVVPMVKTNGCDSMMRNIFSEVLGKHTRALEATGQVDTMSRRRHRAIQSDAQVFPSARLPSESWATRNSNPCDFSRIHRDTQGG